MERVSTKNAARELNIGIDSLQYLMQKGALPIGYAYRRDDKVRFSYVIYRESLDEFKNNLAKGLVGISL